MRVPSALAFRPARPVRAHPRRLVLLVLQRRLGLHVCRLLPAATIGRAAHPIGASIARLRDRVAIVICCTYRLLPAGLSVACVSIHPAPICPQSPVVAFSPLPDTTLLRDTPTSGGGPASFSLRQICVPSCPLVGTMAGIRQPSLSHRTLGIRHSTRAG